MSHDESKCVNCGEGIGVQITKEWTERVAERASTAVPETSDAISAGDTVEVNCPESPEHKEERQGWMGRVVRRNKNACTVEFFADFEERIYEAHHLVKVAEREPRTETARSRCNGTGKEPEKHGS